MKFAFVVSMWFPFGGMQRSLLRIAQACVDTGHEVHIYTGEWRGERPDGAQVFELDTRAASNHASNDRLAEAFAAATADGDYDCRVGFTKIPGLDIYYAGDPCYVARVAETKPFFYTWWARYRAFRRQEAAVFAPGKTTEILLIAHQEKDKFIHYYGTEEQRFHLLPPGINRGPLLALDPADERARLRREFGFGEQHKVLLCVGSGFTTKGVDRVIEAVAELPDDLRTSCRLLVVGRGKAAPLERLVKRRGLGSQVFFLGTRDDVPALYRAADYLVHAARTENTGTALIEAMCSGLPILVSGNCGFADHVRHADAGIVLKQPFDQNELNRELADFIRSERCADWRENGPAYCERTDLYSLIERAAEIIIDRGKQNRRICAEGA